MLAAYRLPIYYCKQFEYNIEEQERRQIFVRNIQIFNHIFPILPLVNTDHQRLLNLNTLVISFHKGKKIFFLTLHKINQCYLIRIVCIPSYIKYVKIFTQTTSVTHIYTYLIVLVYVDLNFYLGLTYIVLTTNVVRSNGYTLAARVPGA